MQLLKLQMLWLLKISDTNDQSKQSKTLYVLCFTVLCHNYSLKFLGCNGVQFIGNYDIPLLFLRNVPHKVLAGMQWAVQNLPSNYLYSSADDDISVHVANTFKFLKGLNSLLDYDVTHSTADVPIVCLYSYQDKDGPTRLPWSKW